MQKLKSSRGSRHALTKRKVMKDCLIYAKVGTIRKKSKSSKTKVADNNQAKGNHDFLNCLFFQNVSIYRTIQSKLSRKCPSVKYFHSKELVHALSQKILLLIFNFQD